MKEFNVNKTVKVTALFSLVGIFIVSILTILSLTLFYPVSLARFASSHGLNEIAIFYYELSYNKTQDINDLYNLLSKTIFVKDYEKVVTNFELLYENGSDSYYAFIDYMNEYNLDRIDNNKYMTSIVNEDARLKEKYVQALYRLGQKEKAFLFAIEDLEREEFLSINDFNKLNFIMNTYYWEMGPALETSDEYERFISYTNETLTNYNFFEVAFSYYNNIKEIYELSFYLNENNIENSFKLDVIAHHLMQVAGALKRIVEDTSYAYDVTGLSNDMDSYYLQINELEQVLNP